MQRFSLALRGHHSESDFGHIVFLELAIQHTLRRKNFIVRLSRGIFDILVIVHVLLLICMKLVAFFLLR